MRVLFIGGTGFISTAVSRQAIAKGFELYLLNRGAWSAHLPGSHRLTADIHKLEDVRVALHDVECGDTIPDARRKAMPGVHLCVECQSEFEKRQATSIGYNRRGSKDSQLK